FNDGSWNTFMDILGEVDNLFTDEAELAAASEENINDLIYELEAAFANLEIDQVDTSIVETAYDAFKQKYDDIDITNLMDFYDDGYGNFICRTFLRSINKRSSAVSGTVKVRETRGSVTKATPDDVIIQATSPAGSERFLTLDEEGNFLFIGEPGIWKIIFESNSLNARYERVIAVGSTPVKMSSIV